MLGDWHGERCCTCDKLKEITKEIKDYLLSVGYPDKEKIFYLEVWLWLWREKKVDKQHLFILDPNEDPEEAIITAIEYLVTNNLIK